MTESSNRLCAYRGRVLHFLADPGDGHDEHAVQFFDDGLLVVENGLVKAAGRAADLLPTLSPQAALVDYSGRLLLPGFVDTHIHLDKACLLGRCGHDHGSVSEAIAAVAAMKRDFTVEDVYARGKKVIERALVHGTTRMRTHVEIDPRIGLRSFEAIKQLKRDYAWAIDLSICVFPQEGLTNDPGAEELLIAARNPCGPGGVDQAEDRK